MSLELMFHFAQSLVLSLLSASQHTFSPPFLSSHHFECALSCSVCPKWENWFQLKCPGKDWNTCNPNTPANSSLIQEACQEYFSGNCGFNDLAQKHLLTLCKPLNGYGYIVSAEECGVGGPSFNVGGSVTVYVIILGSVL